MPTKPLVQLKCVSKQWNLLISDPYFMKSRSRRMIFLPKLPFHVIDNTVTAAPSMINPKSYKNITIVGSFNGIVLLDLKYRNKITVDDNHYDNHMILYNPFSGKFKTVPNHPQSYGTYVYGFGYGTSEDDLKIVRLRRRSSYCYGASKSFEVFSLKTWSWSRPLELLGDYFIRSVSGTVANGFLYWIAGRQTFWPQLLLVLEIKKMVFSEIEIPNEWASSTLGTYNGRICMVCQQQNVDGYELWVMNKHGFGKSWSTVCSFKSFIGVFCFLEDGKLHISKAPQQLIIYDMFKDSYEEVNALTSFREVGGLHSVEYVESSISPSDICSISI